MHLHGRSKFVAAVILWDSVAVVALVAIGTFSLESFFVLALVGYLAAVELITPGAVAPEWSSQLRWVSLLGLVVLGGIVLRKAFETLPEVYLP